MTVYQVWRTYHTKATEGEFKGQWLPSGAMCPASAPVTDLPQEDLDDMLAQAKTDFEYLRKGTGEPDAHFELRVIWPVKPEEWPD